MKVAMIGLGRMGGNMSRRLIKGGHQVSVFDHNRAAMDELGKVGALSLSSLTEIKKMEKPRVVWLMLPAGDITETTVTELYHILEAGDVVVDGGNSYFKDDVRRAKMLQKNGILYMDAGTSGGVWGLERGYCLMVGGAPETFQIMEPALKTLAPGKTSLEATKDRKVNSSEQGYLHCGPVGSGHFVKMIHNGIEYGMMQAFAEGFDIMKNATSTELPSEHRYDLNLGDIAEVWRRGSVVSSWLLDLISQALAGSPKLEEYKGYVNDSGEGRWTVQAAIEESVAAPVITTSLFARFRSRQDHNFGEKMLSAMRAQFGGHQEKK
jgi:6-phosphogluconate dehydrogenase